MTLPPFVPCRSLAVTLVALPFHANHFLLFTLIPFLVILIAFLEQKRKLGIKHVNWGAESRQWPPFIGTKRERKNQYVCVCADVVVVSKGRGSEI